jgi:hypothetical protein
MIAKDDFEINIQTIQMQPPKKGTSRGAERIASKHDQLTEVLIAKEAFLRRLAYKNTTIKTDQSFFDDSDMHSEYYVVVIYDKLTDTPLLSSRYYFDKLVITKCLKGDNEEEMELSYLGKKFNLDNYQEGNIFLADRLSGNVKNFIYRYHRNEIYSLYYSEVLNKNKNRTLLLMVRREKGDKQLSKYLKLGFVLIGSTLHKGKEHSIILHDLKNV